MSRSRRLRILQLVSFVGLVAVLATTTLVWALVPADHVRWTLTPAAFSVLALVFSLLLAFTLTRRPDRLLFAIALVLLLVSALPALSLDRLAVALAPMLSLTVSAACLLAAQLVGGRRSGARALVVVLVVGIACLVPLGCCLLFSSLGAAMGGYSTFARVTSPQGSWTATGSQLNVLATDEGSTEVAVRRDVAGLLRGQLIAYSAVGLSSPRVAWQDRSHLLVGRKVILVPDRQ